MAKQTITLTKKWWTFHKETKTLDLVEGMLILYQFENTQYDTKPSEGVVKKDENGFYIEWDDTETLTRIDGSDHSNKILKDCGWV